MVGSSAARRTKQEKLEYDNRVAAAANIAHRREWARGDQLLDVRLENPLGRLSFRGTISTEQYEAGKRYAGITFNYLESISAPYPFTQSTAFGKSIAGLMETPEDDECLRRKRSYDAAFEALMATGQRPAKTVARVVVYEEEPRDDYDLDCLKIGLAALEKHFRGERSERKIIPFSEFRPMG